MEKYSGTAERLGFVDLPDDLGMYGHRKSVDRTFKRIMKEGKENYLPIVTGHQGEPRAMLTRMGRGETPYEIDDGDKVIFSARVIPEPTNEGQRYQSERLLRMQGARIYDEIHVSGHLREEGHYEMLQALQPQHVIPAHQNLKGFAPYVDLAEVRATKPGGTRHRATVNFKLTESFRTPSAGRRRDCRPTRPGQRRLPEDLPVRSRTPRRGARYLLDAGGKRLRPTVLLLVAESLLDVDPLTADYRDFPTLEGGQADMMSAALAIEVIQSFTLIHDDIMDDDALRRGVPAVHKEYDLSTAILAGDTLYSKAFELLHETGAAPDGRRRDRDSRRRAPASARGRRSTSSSSAAEVLPDEYLQMVELKTAVLYGDGGRNSGLAAGGRRADGRCPVQLRARRGACVPDSGRPAGPDDALEELGKQRGSDLVENKQTLVTLHARQQGVDVGDLVDTDSVEAVSEAEIDDAVERLREEGQSNTPARPGRTSCERQSRLDVLPDNEARDLLVRIADYLIDRGY